MIRILKDRARSNSYRLVIIIVQPLMGVMVSSCVEVPFQEFILFIYLLCEPVPRAAGDGGFAITCVCLSVCMCVCPGRHLFLTFELSHKKISTKLYYEKMEKTN